MVRWGMIDVKNKDTQMEGFTDMLGYKVPHT